MHTAPSRRWVWRVVPALVLLLALVQHARVLVVVRGVYWFVVQLLQVAVMVVGSGSFWWVLRSYQLQKEQELHDQARLKYTFYQRYRDRAIRMNQRSSMGESSSSHVSGAAAAPNGILDADSQLKVVKRLPIGAHLRMGWNLPQEICDEIARFVHCAVRDYVTYWFQPISPHNDDFPSDLRFLLADLLGAMTARVLEIDSSQALAMTAKSIELLRMHLGWFREAYAQLEEEFPEVFQDDESDESNLHKRQEYVAAFAQKSPFLHPGCVVAPGSTTPNASSSSAAGSSFFFGSRKAGHDSPEAVYLRHVASQVLVQLKPQLGLQYDSNVFVSIVMNLMREVTTFKVLKPLTEYSQPRYANELVLSCLQAFLAEKDTLGPLSPNGNTATSTSSGVGMMPSMTLNKLRLTKSFLYKATKRSTEQAEAAFQAVVDAVSSAASSSTGGPAEVIFDGDDWTDAANYALGGGSTSTLHGSAAAVGSRSHSTSHSSSANERKQPFASLFSFDDRISIPRTPRLKTPRNFMPGSSNGPKSSSASSSTTTNGGGGHMDDLKNMKANLGSSLNSSIHKVKRRFRTLSGHPNDPETPGGASNGFSSTQAAARMMKKPGMLLQKALRRQEGPMMMMSPMSPTSSADELLTPPPLTEDDLFHNTSGGDDSSDPPSPARASENAIILNEANDEEQNHEAEEEEEAELGKSSTVQERIVLLLDKTIATYVKMYHERPEMRSSARSRELFEFLSAMEDVFMLGYSDLHMNGDNDEGELTPLSSPRSPGLESNGSDIQQYYWNYLAQDRPETPFLNEHWKFVAAKCPLCADSDSFYSTRGVQWILVALEKGMLWEYVTALHLNTRVTAQFYDHEESVLRNGKWMESVLRSLSQLNKLTMALEIPFLLGRKSDMDEAFGVTSSSHRRGSRVSRSSSNGSSSAMAVRVLESVWEVERYVPIHGWTKAQDKRWQELPSSEWIWEGEWTLEAKPAGAITTVNGGSGDATTESDASSGLWEYAKTFEDRFHDKEKKFDSVRRRKWVRRRRQLPSVLSLGASSVSSVSSPHSGIGPTGPSSPPALFGVASLPAPSPTIVSVGTGKVRNIKQFFDSSKRAMKAKTDDTTIVSPTKRPFVKRRSFSFDKSSLTSPISDLMLSLQSPDKVSFSSKKPSPSGKKKRGSIPSLRRSNTSSDKDVKSAIVLMRAATTSGADESNRRGDALDARTSFGGEWDDDGENLCFRCLTPLQQSVIGNDHTSSSTVSTCQSCQQRVCGSCHNFFAFLVFPPPFESSKKAQVCGTCYERLSCKYKLKIEAHVGKYFIRERDSVDASASASPSSNGTSGSNASTGSANAAVTGASESDASSTSSCSSKGTPKFEITVFVKDEASYAWSVVKTFQEFEALEKALAEKMKQQEKKHGAGCHACHWKGVDYMELVAVEPSLKKLPVAALSYDKRLYVLEEFLQSLLACDTLCQSPVVQKFLSLSNAAIAHTLGSSHPMSPTAAVGTHPGEFGGGNSGEYPLSPGGGMSSNSSASNAGGALLMENGKWKKGRWVAPETNTKETKMRILQKLEVSLFAVVGELFEFDGIGMVRRQLFAMSRSFIKAFLSASHFRRFEKQYLSFTDPKKVAAMIVDFREYMFPDPDASPVPLPPATLSASEMQTLRKDVLDAILASFPSTAVSLFGENSCENAALKLHEFLQHEVFVKNLMFSIGDEVLLHLFPEFVTYKSKKPTTMEQK